jgi:uncharacterized OB-fold protein
MLTDCTAPDFGELEVPMDAWTQPFWDATAEYKLRVPRCAACARYRWPPGPFCPHCQSQLTEWVDPGIARIYSFTIISQQRVPALIEFPTADGIRILAAIVATPLNAIRIGAELSIGWLPAMNARIPVFRIPS